MRITMHDSRLAVRGKVGLQPVRELRDCQRFGLITVVPIAFEQPEKLRNLAFHKGSRPFQLRKRFAFPRDVTQLREARGIGQAA